MTKQPTDAAPSDSTLTPKRRGGAPRGNRNAETTGRYGKHLARLKLSHNARLDSYERAAVNEARAILDELGLAEAATGAALGRQYARLEVVAARLVAMVKSRGMRDRTGRLKGEVGQLVEVVKALLDRLERLMRQAAEHRAETGADSLDAARARINALVDRFPDAIVTEYRCFFSDGRPVSGTFDGDPVAETTITGRGLNDPGLPSPPALQDKAPRTDHPLDVLGAKRSIDTKPNVAPPRQSDLAEAWARGDDLD